MAQEILIGVALLLGLVLACEGGFRLGRRALAGGEPSIGGPIGAIQGAMLGLLGLLLGFSFSGAASRFLERQDLIVQEANAIGTAYLRADLLDEPHRSGLRAGLAHYVDRRLKVSVTLREGLSAEATAEITRMHARIWNAASAGALARPNTTVVVIPPVNEIIDLHSTRLSAARKHLPAPVLGLLIVCSALSMTVIGYGCGLAGRRSLMIAGSLAILIAAALWITIDLDHPRAGIIRLDDRLLKELNFSDSK